jgi:opacity protein-like surface antigen
MKRYQKIILTTLFVVISSSIAFAQFSSLGIKGGLNLSKLDYKDDLQGYDFSFREGMNLGLFTEYNLSNDLLIHAEAIYSMRGTEYGLEEFTWGGITVPAHKFIQKLDYLEIPLMIQYNFLLDSKLTPNVFLGPVASFLLNEKIEYIEDDISKGEVGQEDQIKSTEFGIILGIGTDYSLPSGKIVFDIRYHYGLTNVNNVEQGSKINSSTISFNIGYGFNL